MNLFACNRRLFLSTIIGGLAASAAVRTWPFRVFSFPSEVMTPMPDDVKVIYPMNAAYLHDLDEVYYDSFFVDSAFIKKLRPAQVLFPASTAPASPRMPLWEREVFIP